MSLKRWLSWSALALVVLGAGSASAGLLHGPGKDAGRGFGQGVSETLQPLLANTLADVDSRLAANEQRIGNVLGGLISQTSGEVGVRLDQVDGILEKRLLQVELGADQVIDHGLDKVDGVARSRIAQLDQSLADRITQVSGAVQSALSQADGILQARIADVNGVVAGALDRTDGLLQARIEQVDELAGRRLGNVDVIATKQRLGLERSITRALWVGALIVFVVVLLRALWGEYLAREEEIAKAPAGTRRALCYLSVLGGPLLRHILVGGFVAALLATVPSRLPMAAENDQRALVAQHRSALASSLSELDWTHVRFHASQLEFLDADDATHYKAVAAKAELLRDLLARPTALATTASVSAVLERLAAAERLATRPDPDLQTVHAMILWQTEGTRSGAHRAAAIAARALRSAPSGFTLGPMARLLVEAYLHAPAADGRTVDTLAHFDLNTSAKPSELTPFPSDALETNAGLAAVLGDYAPKTAGSPFEGATALFHLMEQLEEEASASYVRMVEAQIAVMRLPADAPASAFEARNDQAQKVVQAFEAFDGALRDTPLLAANGLVLNVFRCNDALLTRALWFTTQPPTTREWPKRLSELTDPKQRALKLAISPARTVWARRYQSLLAGPARELVELQEADRFAAFEDKAVAYEQAAAALGGVPGPSAAARSQASRAKNKLPAAPEPLLRVNVANAAAALDLYTDAGSGAARQRSPLALQITGDIDKLKLQAQQAVLQAQRGADQQLQKIQGNLQQQLEDAVKKLHQQLQQRGTQLI